MRLLRGAWRLMVAIKDGLALLVLLLFFGMLFAILSARPNPTISQAGALLLDLNGSIVEQPAEAAPLALLTDSGRSMTREYRLRDLIRAAETAASDSRVKVVVLDLDGFSGGGQAAIDEFGRALDKVRKSGKPVLAFATAYGDDSYALAAHASEVWLNPMGAVLLTGPGSSHLYYKGLLDKLGVDVRVYRVGQFKSAVEPFTRNDQSPEARIAAQALVDSLWGSWRRQVAASRPQAQIDSYVGNMPARVTAAGGDLARAAGQAGLIDHLGDRYKFGRRVAEIAGADSDRGPGGFKTIRLDRWLAANPAPDSGPAIGVVTIAGDIVDGEAPIGEAGGETVARLIEKALAKKNLKALVVRVDSPGGSVTASEQIRNAIAEARNRMPVVVSMGSVAASGGYWVSTPAQRIYAEPSTITGSIGVFGLLPTFKTTLTKAGLGADGVKSTPLSGEPDLLRGPTPQVEQIMQLGVNDIYRRFTTLVGQARRLPVAQVDAIGQGRVWAGNTARSLGLVDAYGGLDDAIAAAARLAKLDPKKVHAEYIERTPPLPLQLLADLARDRGGDNGQAIDPFGALAGRPNALLAQALSDATRIAGGPAIQVRCLDCGPGDSRQRPATEGFVALLLARFGLN